jgi:hypothetical protein
MWPWIIHTDGFFGAALYFILVASLVSITDGVDFNNSLAIIAISVIAGSSWSAALEMIKGL